MLRAPLVRRSQDFERQVPAAGGPAGVIRRPAGRADARVAAVLDYRKGPGPGCPGLEIQAAFPPAVDQRQGAVGVPAPARSRGRGGGWAAAGKATSPGPPTPRPTTP